MILSTNLLDTYDNLKSYLLPTSFIFTTNLGKTNDELSISLLIRDMWAAYNGIQQALPPNQVPYQHLVVNHSQNFVDPVTQACTNHVEVITNMTYPEIMNFSNISHLKFIAVLLEKCEIQV